MGFKFGMELGKNDLRDDLKVVIKNDGILIYNGGSWVAGEPDFSCSVCGCGLVEDDCWYGPGDEPLCEGCYNEHCCRCDGCDRVLWCDDDRTFWVNGYCYCEDCFYDTYTYCGEVIRWEDAKRDPDDDPLCEYCFGELCVECVACVKAMWKDKVEHRLCDGAPVCEECAKAKCVKCELCGELELSHYVKARDGKKICLKCQSQGGAR